MGQTDQRPPGRSSGHSAPDQRGFSASSYCFDIETKRALERHEANTARVVPIILRPVYWKLAPFAALQALPADARAITEWPNLDLAFVNVCEGILAVVLAWKNEARSTAPASPERSSLDPVFTIRRLRTGARVLDAALPRRVLKGKATALVAMLRRVDSSGLREIVEIDTSYGVEAGDVRSTKSFPLKFPVDASGKIGPLDLVLKIDSPDFEPRFQSKTVTVPPRGDSDPRVFLLTPTREGDLVVGLGLCQGDSEIAACLLRTSADQAESDVVARAQALVSIPLTTALDDEVSGDDVKLTVTRTARPESDETQLLRNRSGGTDEGATRERYEAGNESYEAEDATRAWSREARRYPPRMASSPPPGLPLPKRHRFPWHAGVAGAIAFLTVIVLLIRHC